MLLQHETSKLDKLQSMNLLDMTTGEWIQMLSCLIVYRDLLRLRPLPLLHPRPIQEAASCPSRLQGSCDTVLDLRRNI
jgi:hypothetical protein